VIWLHRPPRLKFRSSFFNLYSNDKDFITIFRTGFFTGYSRSNLEIGTVDIHKDVMIESLNGG
jgi:hypothetical protein